MSLLEIATVLVLAVVLIVTAVGAWAWRQIGKEYDRPIAEWKREAWKP